MERRGYEAGPEKREIDERGEETQGKGKWEVSGPAKEKKRRRMKERRKRRDTRKERRE